MLYVADEGIGIPAKICPGYLTGITGWIAVCAAARPASVSVFFLSMLSSKATRGRSGCTAK